MIQPLDPGMVITLRDVFLSVERLAAEITTLRTAVVEITSGQAGIINDLADHEIRIRTLEKSVVTVEQLRIERSRTLAVLGVLAAFISAAVSVIAIILTQK